MAFFMVMFAMSQVDAKKFQQLAGSLNSAFSHPMGNLIPKPAGMAGPLAVLPRAPKGGTTQDMQDGKSRARSIREMQQDFLKLVKEGGLEKSVTVTASPDGQRLIVRLADSLLFAAGNADLSDPAKQLMANVAKILVQAGKPVQIEGHTDNVPISRGGRYESNWQLSTARATNVLIYLVENYGMPPEKLSAGGYGEYRPVATNDTPEGRAQNRRVEFVIGNDEGSNAAEEPAAPESPTTPAP
jgi:chemotaxis protein MotB